MEEHDCVQDCEICWEEHQKEMRRFEGERHARLESAQQRSLWGGILWDSVDPLCQEITAQIKEEQ